MDLDEKQPLRQELIAARRALDPAFVQEASLAICRRIFELPELEAAQTVALYQALRNEIELRALWDALAGTGKRVLFPRIHPGTRVLAFAPVDDPAELTVGALGVRQPPPERDVPLEEIDAFVVPALAFDPAGRRLGRGGGYYDATLAAAPAALRIGPCLESQLRQRLPVEAHDAPVDLVVTQERVLRCGARAR